MNKYVNAIVTLLKWVKKYFCVLAIFPLCKIRCMCMQCLFVRAKTTGAFKKEASKHHKILLNSLQIFFVCVTKTLLTFLLVFRDFFHTQNTFLFQMFSFAQCLCLNYNNNKKNNCVNNRITFIVLL